MTPTNQKEDDKKYDRLYLTKYEKILKEHGIVEDAEIFIDKAFYHYLEKKTGEPNGKKEQTCEPVL